MGQGSSCCVSSKNKEGQQFDMSFTESDSSQTNSSASQSSRSKSSRRKQPNPQLQKLLEEQIKANVNKEIERVKIIQVEDQGMPCIKIEMASQKVDQRDYKDMNQLIQCDSEIFDQSNQKGYQDNDQQADKNIESNFNEEEKVPAKAEGSKRLSKKQKKPKKEKTNQRKVQTGQIKFQAKLAEQFFQSGVESMKQRFCTQQVLHKKTSKIGNIKDLALRQRKGIDYVYDMLNIVGQGSFGCVKTVLHRELQVIRACKMLKKANLDGEEEFINEINMLITVDHPNILKYYERFEDKHNYYIVTEFCEGGELINYALNNGGLEEEIVSRIMAQLLSACSYIHQQGLVHRDLKCENMLLKSKQIQKKDIQVKIIDFGISTRLKPNETLKQTFGTPYYIAPEVLKHNYNEKCDIWSCGVIMYILLCGYPPFRGRTHNELNRNICQTQPSFQGYEWDCVSDDAKSIILTMLTKDFEKRPSARDLMNHTFVKSKYERKNTDKRFGLRAFENLRNFNAESKMNLAIKAFFSNFTQNEKFESKLGEVFLQMDKDNDGTLSKEELAEAYDFFGENCYITDEEVDRIFDIVDANGNGQIDYSEFVMAASSLTHLMSERQLRAAFNAFDLDGSGEISLEELQEAFSLGAGLTIAELKELLDEFDDNKNGLISFEEFQMMVRKVFQKFSQTTH